MEKSLKYRNEEDRCYGATGMAIGLVVFDGEDQLNYVTLDGEPGEMVSLSESFYFSGNPRLSAKNSWNQLLKNFNLMMAMTISNVICRSLVLDKMPLRFEVKSALYNSVEAEAEDTCQLEKDEIQRLFDKNYNYLYRVFNHSGVQSIAVDFANRLAQQRRMTRAEVLDALHALGML